MVNKVEVEVNCSSCWQKKVYGYHRYDFMAFVDAICHGLVKQFSGLEVSVVYAAF